jgi:hypothetical protein
MRVRGGVRKMRLNRQEAKKRNAFLPQLKRQIHTDKFKILTVAIQNSERWR